jgi:hypothetical protein
MVKYRSHGRQRWYTIGKHGSPWTPELARREAKRILGLATLGKDRADRKQKDRSAPTIGALADRFLEEHVEAKSNDRTYSEYRRLIERIVKPELGRRKVEEVRQSDIEHLHLKFRVTIRRTASWRCSPKCSTGPADGVSATRAEAWSALRSRSGGATFPQPSSQDWGPRWCGLRSG